MKFAVSVSMLGYTRVNGLCVYDGRTREFLDLTPAEARDMIDKGEIKGVLHKKTEDGIVFMTDSEGFNQYDILIKSSNQYRSLNFEEIGSNILNSIYTLVRVIDTDYRGRAYEVVSTKHARIKLSESELRELNSISPIAGCRISEENIEILEGVDYQDRRKKEQMESSDSTSEGVEGKTEDVAKSDNKKAATNKKKK